MAGSSVVMHDFDGKKAKILATLRSIDDVKSGMVRFEVLSDLIGCLEMNITKDDFKNLRRQYGMNYQGVDFIKYDPVLKQLKFDNHSEKWYLQKGLTSDLGNPYQSRRRNGGSNMYTSLEPR